MSGIFASLGLSFNSNTLKVKLKMSVSRMAMNLNKYNNQLISDKKTVASLLKDHKDESARIRVEGIIHQRHLINVLEILSLMCELLSTRIGLLTSQNECSVDLEESIASIIYCSRRLDTVPELNDCTDQFQKKYGAKFVQSHVNNGAHRVNPRIVDKLSVTPPSFEIVLQQMQDIADEHGVEWKPNLSMIQDGNDSDDIYKLGSITGQNAQPLPSTSSIPYMPAPPVAAADFAPIPPAIVDSPHATQSAPSNQGAQLAYINSLPHYSDLNKQSSTQNMYPGSLAVHLHAAQNVQAPAGLVVAGIVVRIQDCQTMQEWRSDARFADSNMLFSWPNMRAEFDVRAPLDKLLLEIRGVAADTLLGATIVNVDTLRRSAEHTGFETHRQHSSDLSGSTGVIVLSTEFTPLGSNDSDDSGSPSVHHQHQMSTGSVPGGIDLNEPPPQYTDAVQLATPQLQTAQPAAANSISGSTTQRIANNANTDDTSLASRLRKLG